MNRHFNEPTDRIYKKNYRPSLFRTSTKKVFYKILAIRLATIIHKLISYNQFAYIPGRVISDPIHIIRLLLHRARYKKLKQAIIFVDLAKAFDTVGHIFIEMTLRAMNFPERFITWAMMFFRQSEVQIIVNAFLADPYNPSAGGKQGDHLFHLIFICFMLGLIAIIEMDDTTTGIQIPHTTRRLKILAFVDDCNLFAGHVTHLGMYTTSMFSMRLVALAVTGIKQ